MDEGRKHDVVEINKGLKSPDPIVRKNAREAGERISQERLDGWVRVARQKLIEETRKGNAGNVRDINEDIVKHKKMGVGKTSFSFSGLPWKDYE